MIAEKRKLFFSLLLLMNANKSSRCCCHRAASKAATQSNWGIGNRLSGCRGHDRVRMCFDFPSRAKGILAILPCFMSATPIAPRALRNDAGMTGPSHTHE